MNPMIRHSVLVNRLVLFGTAALFCMIALRTILDPVGTAASHHITLGAAEAVTVERVSGAVFLALAVVLAGCAASERRIVVGAALLSVVSATLTAVRLLGLALDGPAAFTLHVLKPEIAITVLAFSGFVLELRRLRAISPWHGRSPVRDPARV